MFSVASTKGKEQCNHELLYLEVGKLNMILPNRKPRENIQRNTHKKTDETNVDSLTYVLSAQHISALKKKILRAILKFAMA